MGMQSSPGVPRGTRLVVRSGWIKSVSFSPDGKTLCLGSRDNTASLIDVATAEVDK